MIEKYKMTQQNAIQLFEGKQVRMSWNEEDGKYIKRMRARDLELNSSRGTIRTPTEMTAIDGKKDSCDAVANSYHQFCGKLQLEEADELLTNCKQQKSGRC